MVNKYNPLELLKYAWDKYVLSYEAQKYINKRLLELDYCIECDNTRSVEVIKNCTKPMSQCCGGCTETVTCENC